jgi:hypothetical protein
VTVVGQTPETGAHVQGDSNSNLSAVEALKFAQQFREYHHKALWEEEKHFTWLLSIILAAQAAVLTAKGSDLPARAPILIVLAVIGLAFVAVALRVVRREGAFFVSAHAVFVPFYNRQFPDRPLAAPPVAANRPVLLLPLLLFVPWKLSIRDAFQVVLLVFGVTYLGLLIAAVKHAV